jgi:hypothetical protein
MISAAELCSPVAAILRTIEAQALEAETKGLQFICLTTVPNYLPNRAACDAELLAKGYAIAYGCLGWGSFPKILDSAPV